MKLTLGDKVCIDNLRKDRYPQIKDDYEDEDEDTVKVERDEYGEIITFSKPKKPKKHIAKRIIEEAVNLPVEEKLVEIEDEITVLEND